MSSLDFQSFGGLLFEQLGLTSTVSGITTTVGLYDSAGGGTTVTHVPPTALNYVLGSQITQFKSGASYQTFTNGIVSINVPSSTRNVQATIMYSSGGNGYIDLNGTNATSYNGQIRLLRGPSTVIANYILQNLVEGAGATFFTWRSPVTSLIFRDFSPPSGAATYILQAQTDGLSTQIGFNGSNLFVEVL